MDFKEKAIEHKILEIRVGSHLFGTSTPESDIDLYGLFMPFDEIIYGSYQCEEVKFDVQAKDETGRNTKDAVDHTLCEYRKFIKLAMQNNPNIMNSLFVNKENILFINEFGQNLLDKAELFPHKGCFDRFIKYADSQKHKMMIKQENFTGLNEAVEVLSKEPDNNLLYKYEKTKPFTYNGGRHLLAGDLHLDIALTVKDALKVLNQRISKATNRTQLYTKYGFDVKYSGNLIQLLMEGIEILTTGRIEFPLTYRKDILDIKQGKYTAEQIIKWSEELADQARSAYSESVLPVHPRTKEIEAFAMSEVKRYCIFQETVLKAPERA